MRKKLDTLKFEVKEEIVKLLANIYLLHNGCYPNWSADEELVIEDSELGHSILIDVFIETENGYIVERCPIEEYRVNCGGDLFFVWGEGYNERSWDEECLEALIGIYEYLDRFWNKIK